MAIGLSRLRLRVKLFSRNNKSFNRRFPRMVSALDKLPTDSILDGEAVAIDESGRPSFNHVQNFVRNKTAIHFYAFDVLAWKGKDLRNKQLWERRASLKKEVIPKLPGDRFSESFSASADEIVAAVRAQGLEGVVAKRLDSKYECGERSGAWVKMRINAQEFVIGGYTPAPRNFDARLIGYYEGSKLIFVTKTRNGFNPMIRDTVFKKLKSLRTEKCPFANLPETKKGRWGNH
jgi:ATP-dependent DNA ligase